MQTMSYQMMIIKNNPQNLLSLSFLMESDIKVKQNLKIWQRAIFFKLIFVQGISIYLDSCTVSSAETEH